MLVLVFVVAGPVREAQAQTPTAKVASIDIRGNKKIELPAIQGRLTLKPGDPYTPENMRGQSKSSMKPAISRTCRSKLNRCRRGLR